MSLAEEIYRVTKQGEFARDWGLRDQVRKAVVSIPSNIAEGAARKNRKEYLQFLYIARGSLSELDTLLEISKKLNYIKKEEFY